MVRTTIPELRPARAGALFVAFSVLCVLGQLANHPAGHVAGSACGIAALALAIQAMRGSYPFVRGQRPLWGRTIDLEQTARATLPALLVVAVSAVYLSLTFRGEMPLSSDHPVHFLHGREFLEFLKTGRISGWSETWAFGYPAGDLYSLGINLWIAAARVLTLGLLSWEATYTISFFSAIAFSTYTIYSFGRRNFGTAVGVLAALLWMFDPGAWEQGGWRWSVHYGVWPSTLSLAFAVMALGRLADVIDRSRRRDTLSCAAWVAAALITHQASIAFLGVTVPLYLVARRITGRGGARRAIEATLTTLTLGFALAAFWVYPMLARADWTMNLGHLGSPLAETAGRLVKGSLFREGWPGILFLGLFGGAFGTATRRLGATFALICAGVFVFLSSSSLLSDFHAAELSEAFLRLRYPRFILFAKVFLFPLSAFAVVESFRWIVLRLRRTERLSAGRVAVVTALAALVLSPFIRPLVVHVYHTYVEREVETARTMPNWDDFRRYLAWTAERHSVEKEFYRIAYDLGEHNHLVFMAPVYDGTPMYKVGYTPASLFANLPVTKETWLLQALSVKYVATTSIDLPYLKPERRFGSIHVYRFAGYDPRRFALDGPGEVEVVEFGAERVHLRLAGVRAGSRLRLFVAHYPRWEARLDGVVIPISSAPVRGAYYPVLMEVAVEDGDLVFEYVRRSVDWIGMALTWITLCGIALGTIGSRNARLSEWSRAVLEPGARALAGSLPWIVAVFAVGAVGVGQRLTPSNGMTGASLIERLDRARVTEGVERCDEWARGAWHCREGQVGPAVLDIGYGIRRCLSIPSAGRPVEIAFPGTRLGRTLWGGYLAESFGGLLEVVIDGRRVATLRSQRGWHRFRVDTQSYAGVKHDVTLRLNGESIACVDLKVDD